MDIFRCMCCGGQIEVSGDTSVGECSSCGHTQVIPDFLEERLSGQFKRAEICFINGEFELAEELYNQITDDYPDNAAANWGCCLSRFGIKYINDEMTGNRRPCCTRFVNRSITDDPFYAKAIAFADSEAGDVIRAEARLIENIQKELSENKVVNEICDVYLCFKSTDDNGEYTYDRKKAVEIRRYLENEHYSVFLSDNPENEVSIFRALKSARVMVLLASKKEYVDNINVKNQWERFIGVMGFDNSKKIIVCYSNMNPDKELPGEFKGLEALNMEPFEFMTLLHKNIERILGRVTEKRIVTQKNYNPSQAIKDRIDVFLSNEQRDEAIKYCETYIKDYKDDADIYWLSILLHYNAEKTGVLPVKAIINNCLEEYQKKIKNSHIIYDEKIADTIASAHLLNRADKAIELASEENKGRYIQIRNAVHHGLKEAIYIKYYSDGCELLSKKRFDEAREIFNDLGDYKDSRVMVKKIAVDKKEYEYKQACEMLDKKQFDSAYKAFSDLGDYKESIVLMNKAMVEKKKAKDERIYKEKIEKYDLATQLFQSYNLKKIDINSVRDGMYQKWLTDTLIILEKNASGYEDVAEMFRRLGDFNDSSDMYKKCVKVSDNQKKKRKKYEELYVKRRAGIIKKQKIIDITLILILVIGMIITRNVYFVPFASYFMAIFPVIGSAVKIGAEENGSDKHKFYTFLFFVFQVIGIIVLDGTIDSITLIVVHSGIVYAVSSIITHLVLRKSIAKYFAKNYFK